MAGINQVATNNPQGTPKADFRQMPISAQAKAVLEEQGLPTNFNNVGELNKFMGELQQANQGKYEALFEQMHPGMLRSGLPNLQGYEKLEMSPIQKIGR